MHVVVITGWPGEAEDPARVLAGCLGLTVYEARQRMVGGGPAVVASFADPQQAVMLAAELGRSGLAAMVIDTGTLRGSSGRVIVRRFVFGERSVSIESEDGHSLELAFREVDLLLPGTRISGHEGTVTVAERKLSLGKTILSGGIPMTSKVERQERVASEESEKVLFVYADSRPQLMFRQNLLSYDGFGTAMKMSRELNFAYLSGELRRLCPDALYDDRLLSRVGQARVLGPVQNLEKNLDLAAEILARCLRSSQIV
jgi:hypothetical protein